MSESQRSISEIYKGLGDLGQKQQIEKAAQLLRESGVVDEAFAAERVRFDEFLANEAFYPSGTRKPLPRRTKPEVQSTAEFARLLWEPPRWRVEGHPGLDFHYVDREIVTSRTTGGGEYAPLSMDLLLANAEDRTPIAAELKLGGDQNAFYALIQCLVHAARLSTPNQIGRLRRFYQDHFDVEDGPESLDLYVVLRDHPRAGTRPELLRQAEELAAAVMVDRTAISRAVRQIACISAIVDADPVSFEVEFAAGG